MQSLTRVSFRSAGTPTHFNNIQLPAAAFPQNNYTANAPPASNGYSTPYASNGHTTPTAGASQSNQYNQTPQSPIGFPGQYQANTAEQPAFNHQQQSQGNYMMTSQGAGAMGPPLKPADKTKEETVDPMDVLAGSGVDIQEEERLLASTFAQQTNSFTQFPPAGESSFYGAGPANAAPETPQAESQLEYECKVAEDAWKLASKSLAESRQHELAKPFLEISLLHKKAVKIARENGVTLRVDEQGGMGRMKLPEQFSYPTGPPTVNINTKAGSDGLIATTKGEFLPYDSLLVDQLALLSIATKQRLRVMIGDAYRLSKGRREGSDGTIPAEWADAAIPNTESVSIVPEGAPRSGWESAISPHSNPVSRKLYTVACQPKLI
jgi:hypothetical protein